MTDANNGYARLGMNPFLTVSPENTCETPMGEFMLKELQLRVQCMSICVKDQAATAVQPKQAQGRHEALPAVCMQAPLQNGCTAECANNRSRH